MKIAFDAKRAFRNYSGLGNYSRTVISLLAEKYPENEYILFTPGMDYKGTDFPPPAARIISPETYLERKFSSWWRTFRIAGIAGKEKPDIYHGLSHELPRHIRSAQLKSVVSIHDLIFMRFPELYKPIDRMIYRRKWQHAVDQADLVIAISEQTKRDILEYLGADESKIRVIYQSGNPVFGQEMGEEQKKAILAKYNLPKDFILSVGTIERRKNLLELVKAVHFGHTEFPLVIIGKEKKEYAAEVHGYISKHGLKNIHFLKNVPTADLPALYQAAMLFVYPSSFEGFGLPVLEALQSGVPVIAGKGSCLEETGGPDSVYIDPMNTEEFSAEIFRLLNDKELRLEMAVRGKSFARRFDQDVFAANLIQLYESLCRF